MEKTIFEAKTFGMKDDSSSKAMFLCIHQPLDLPTPQPSSLDEVEVILGYNFKNKCLLEEAFTHSSYYIEESERYLSYERLSYVGDAILNLLVTQEHFLSHPKLQPGPLTRLRAINVDTEKLARAAVKHGLDRYLRHKKPMLEEQVHQFKKEILEYPLHSNGLIDAPKTLADIVESTIGALYLDSDSNIDTVWKVVRNLLEPMINPDTIKTQPVTELHEFCQKMNLKLKFVDLWKETKGFNVLIGDMLMGRGVYGTKKEIAYNRAAKSAVVNIKRIFSTKQSFR